MTETGCFCLKVAGKPPSVIGRREEMPDCRTESLRTRYDVVRILAAPVVFIMLLNFSVQGQENVYGEMTAWMQQTKRASGSLPGFSEMFARMTEVRERLTAEQRTQLWKEWSAAQKPSMSVEDMVKAAQARRAAIETARISYSVQSEEQDEAGVLQPPRYYRESFLMAPDGLKTEVQEGTSSDQLKPRAMRAYDGEIVRAVYRGEKAGVTPFEHRSSFFRYGNPLWPQRLLDAERDAEMPGYMDCDLETFLTASGGFVLEATELVDGRRALVCTSAAVPISVVWLDVERNFAVLKSQSIFVEWNNRKAENWRLTETTECLDFRDCGNGVWLPGEIRTVGYSREDGSVNRRITVKVEEAEINGEVAHSEFVDIFPSGIEVIDGVANKIYRAGRVEDSEKELTRLVEEIKIDMEATDVSAAEPPGLTTAPEPVASAAEAEAGAGESHLGVWIACAAVVLCAAGMLVIRARRHAKGG